MKTFLTRKVVGFDFFFCFLTNSVFIKRGRVWNKHTLTSKFFYAVRGHGAVAAYVVKFFNDNRSFWKFFWTILTMNRVGSCGFFAELELIGLGFRIRKIISTIYRFF